MQEKIQQPCYQRDTQVSWHRGGNRTALSQAAGPELLMFFLMGGWECNVTKIFTVVFRTAWQGLVQGSLCC